MGIRLGNVEVRSAYCAHFIYCVELSGLIIGSGSLYLSQPAGARPRVWQSASAETGVVVWPAPGRELLLAGEWTWAELCAGGLATPVEGTLPRGPDTLVAPIRGGLCSGCMWASWFRVVKAGLRF